LKLDSTSATAETGAQSIAPAGKDDGSNRLVVLEVPLIPDSDLEALQSFNGHWSITLSAYLRLDTPERRESAYDEFIQQMKLRLEECVPKPECREALKEDMEIVGLYLRTNGHRNYPGLAIFSCASELFWRVYSLPAPLCTRVSVGPQFDVSPLKEALEQSAVR
jgi:hypothetical protein